MKQFFLQGEIDGVPVRWLVLRSADSAVTWLDEHLVQEVVASTWARTTFSRLDGYRQSCRRRKIMFQSPRGRRHLLGAAQLIPPALHPVTHPPGPNGWEFYDI